MSENILGAGVEEHRPPGARSLFVTGLGIGQVCSWGSLYYSFPLIAEAMGHELGWSKSALYGAATLGLALAGLAAYPIGAAIDRGHGRAIMTIGSVLAGLLLLLWSQVESMALFYVAVAGIGALQAATLYDPAFAVIARRSGPSHARAGITALTLWGGFASTVFIPLVQLLLDQVGWRDALLVLAAINILICAGCYWAVIDPAADAPTHRASSGPAPLSGRAAVAWAARQPVFWALAVAFTAYSAAFSAFTFHLYPLLVEKGFETASVVAAMTLIGPAQVAGRIAIWVFAPRAPVRLIGSVTVAIFPLALIGLDVLPPSFLLIAVVALLYGAANGITTIVRGLSVPEMLTREAYGAVNGAMSAPSTISRALAPLGAALIWSMSGSYDGVLLAIIALTVLLAVGFWLAALLSRRAPAV
ncbi:MFS transporter [Ancylobacter dichloromethanicus]|uniref:MFS transporter n=1 Tax=Ancylobacter dichloromethanicus TaxID=518825 RepID=A0A9W6JBZ7_9HYPH|nr:MFS transporter [Ancylobacter dichloromethanicus]MBS7556638.1 MFS transporter [Ancylobacter dichloromethanicus]GLK73488.1 MFS transporter [Ancylobacter dichloromethanicus]